MATLEGHTSAVHALAALKAGRFASGSKDTTVKVWTIKSSGHSDETIGQCDATLQGHSGYVNALAVLQDGRLASGSEDQTIKVCCIFRSRIPGASEISKKNF